MYICTVFVILVLTMLCAANAVHIIWDNDMPMDYDDIEYGRMEEIRLANWFFIYPGTKWCGAGNIAEDYNDLGDYARSDKCCRAHDNCDQLIEGYQTAYNLTNPGFYSRLSCQCDEEFYRCLKSINSRDSQIIGNIYFNALSTKCFKEEFPVKRCGKYIYFPSRKCTSYDFDETKDKIFQWFDIPRF